MDKSISELADESLKKNQKGIFDCFGECDKCHSDDIKVFRRYDEFHVVDNDNCECTNCHTMGKVRVKYLFVGECYVDTEYWIEWDK